MRKPKEYAHDSHIILKRIGEELTVGWVASSFKAISAIWRSFPALVQHFHNAFENETKQRIEKARFFGLTPKLSNIFGRNLALLVDVTNEFKNLSETLQNENTTLPKANNLFTIQGGPKVGGQ